MALFKIDERYPDYKDRFFDGYDIRNTSVYARLGWYDEKVGSIDNILIDEQGCFHYLVIDTGFWVFGKKVLLPVGRCVDDPERNRVYAIGLTKEQVERLPEYRDDFVIDHSYEQRIRSIYQIASVEGTAPVESSVPIESPVGTAGYLASQSVSTPSVISKPTQVTQPREESNLDDRASDLQAAKASNHQRLRLYEERLVADKHREKTGEVRIFKRIETKQVEASVPIQKEKIVIEIESVRGVAHIHAPNEQIQDGVITLETYAEQANIRKEAVVRQEVTIRKEVQQAVVTAQETLRYEELDVKESPSV